MWQGCFRLSLVMQSARKGLYRFYIQGVGTPFPEIGEPTESAEGKAFAKGASTDHLGFVSGTKQPSHGCSQSETDVCGPMIGKLTQAYEREVGQPANRHQRDNKRITHKDWFDTHRQARSRAQGQPKPHIPTLRVSVLAFPEEG